MLDPRNVFEKNFRTHLVVVYGLGHKCDRTPFAHRTATSSIVGARAVWASWVPIVRGASPARGSQCPPCPVIGVGVCVHAPVLLCVPRCVWLASWASAGYYSAVQRVRWRRLIVCLCLCLCCRFCPPQNRSGFAPHRQFGFPPPFVSVEPFAVGVLSLSLDGGLFFLFLREFVSGEGCTCAALTDSSAEP